MKKDDLTCLKNIGVSRMKLLNDAGITTIEQLCETPIEKLCQIKFIGERYSKLIKESAEEFFKNRVKLTENTISAKEKKPGKIKDNFQKKISRLDNNLHQAKENLKPLWKKKYLELYIDFKKKSKKFYWVRPVTIVSVAGADTSDIVCCCCCCVNSLLSLSS